jgi:uncharacterized membrane protein
MRTAAFSTCATIKEAMPIHPILVHFPLSLVTVALGADVIGRLRPTPRPERSASGAWSSPLSAAAAVAAGFIDMYRADLADATHRFVHLHRSIGLVLLAALALLAVWRWRIWRGTAADRVGWPYLLAAMAVFALVLFQGWFGGELVYGHGAGVSAAGHGVESPEEGQMGLAPFARFTEAAHDHRGHH